MSGPMAKVEALRMKADAARRAGDREKERAIRDRVDQMITKLQAAGSIGCLEFEDTPEEDEEHVGI